MSRKLPTVVIIGRPNVGKSSLFNRILGRRKAIVEEASGTTRDRLSVVCNWQGRRFELIDTGGMILVSSGSIEKKVVGQIKTAIKQADVLVFVCDVTSGVTGMDEEAASLARQSGKMAFLVVNKADDDKKRQDISEFYRLGFERLYPVSAMHGKGIGDLLDDVAACLTKDVVPPAPEQQKEPIKAAIVGKPNVGKSSLLNYILKEERVIVDDKPGTTRDSIDTHLITDGEEFLLIDTAGIRHEKKLKDAVSFYSLSRSQDAITRSDVCLFLIDAMEGLTVDDLKILDYIDRQNKGCVFIVNKWDLVKRIETSKYRDLLHNRAPFIKAMPVLFISAVTGRNTDDVLPQVIAVYKNYTAQIQTKLLNHELEALQKIKAAPALNFKRPKLNYISQVSTKPPRFAIFTNHPDMIKRDYAKFIENGLKERFGLSGAPIVVEYRKK